MRMYKVSVVAVTVLALGALSAHAGFGGLVSKVPGLGGGSSGAASVDVGALKESVNAKADGLSIAKGQLIEAELLYAEALGLKEKADAIMSAATGIKEGGTAATKMTSDQMEKVTDGLKDIMPKAEAEVAPLTDEQKQKFREGHIAFGKAGVLFLGEAGATIGLCTKVVSDVKSINGDPIKGAKAVALGAAAAKLLSMTIADSKRIIEVYGVMSKVAENNHIDVEKVELKLPADVG